MASPKRLPPIARFVKAEYLVVLFVGMFFGHSFTSIYNHTILSKQKLPSKGDIKQLSETPIRKTSHIDDQGRPITKQQLLEPFVLPNLVGFSIATFLPGQTMMPPHEHETLYEIFYVIEGKKFFHKDKRSLHSLIVLNCQNFPIIFFIFLCALKTRIGYL